MAENEPPAKKKEKSNAVVVAIGGIVVAICGLIVFAINDSGKQWYYHHLTTADVTFRVYNDTANASGAKVFLDKDSSLVGDDGSTAFESVSKGKHTSLVTYKGQKRNRTFIIPDTAHTFIVTEIFNSTRHGSAVPGKHRPSVAAAVKVHLPDSPASHRQPPAVLPPKIVSVAPSQPVAPVLEKTFPETYCKRQHYILFDHIKVWVDEVHLDEQSANFQICYTAQLNANCDNVIQEDIPIKIDAPFAFPDRGKGYKLKISRFSGKSAVYLILEQYDKP